MKRSMYGPDHDRVSRRVGEDILGRALRSVLTPSQQRLLLDYLHGAPKRQLAAQLGFDERQLDVAVGRLLSRLRDSQWGDQLREELLRPEGPQFSLQVWEGVSEVPVHRCERTGCTAPPLTQKLKGRPRQYCSAGCKQAAYRARVKGAGASAMAPAPHSEVRADRFFWSQDRVRRRLYRFEEYTDGPVEFPVLEPQSGAAADGDAWWESYRLDRWMPRKASTGPRQWTSPAMPARWTPWHGGTGDAPQALREAWFPRLTPWLSGTGVVPLALRAPRLPRMMICGFLSVVVRRCVVSSVGVGFWLFGLL
ncbi:hypothetical protein OG311_00050 [Streptomyces sp. NBC_01343]|uniref:hypothetical protein n=1 Tax=Streptomyces sp. NBC_01343 TaxID=2903832 RepID=UPI002E0D9924|nr:hypothetical protein OG311_00050 [Streptomyces sp. NBC_01343]